MNLMQASIIWHSQKRKISDLKPAPYNPRELTEKQAQDLATSLELFNLAEPIVINQNNTIVGGHQRINILKAKYGNNGAEVDVRVPNRLLTQDEEVELNLRLNKNLGHLANFDEDLLKDVGFDSRELDNIFQLDTKPEDDDMPEQRITDIKLGDMFELGEHVLLCGDCTAEANVARLMGGLKADMVFTDPPYGVSYGRDNEKLEDTAKSYHWSKTRVNSQILNDNLSTEECAEKIWRPSFKNMYEFAKDDCSFYMTMCQGGKQMMMMMMVMVSEHWQVKHELIWVKSSPVFSMGRLDYDYQHEPILFGWKKKHNWYGGGQFLKSIWEVDKPHKSEEHPTMKPIVLMENALIKSSMRENIILDLFGGSGSTLIACEKLNRKCRMTEIDPIYCQVIIDRWQNFTGKKAKKLNVGSNSDELVGC